MATTSRLQEDGSLARNRIFWNSCRNFEQNLREMEQCHIEIYDRYILRHGSLAELDRDPGIKKLERLMDSAARVDRQNVPVEMFLYATKGAPPQLLPGDLPGMTPALAAEEIAEAYAALLAHKLDAAVAAAEGIDPAKNRAVQAYLHVLRDWPRDDTWNTVQCLALRVYGKLLYLDLPEAEAEVSARLNEKRYCRTAFLALLHKRDNGGYSLKRMEKLLNFLAEQGRSANRTNRQTYQDLLRDFEALVAEVQEKDEELYGWLWKAADDLRKRRKLPAELQRRFPEQMEDPLAEVNNLPLQEQVQYVTERFDGYSVYWRRWLRNLKSKPLFDAVCRQYEQRAYPAGNAAYSSYLLCGFAEMTDPALGKEYLSRITGPQSAFPARDRTEEFLQLCARNFAFFPDATIERICGVYESLESFEVEKAQRQAQLIARRRDYQDFLRERIAVRIRSARDGDENALMELLNWLQRYLFADLLLREKIIPFATVLRKVRLGCHLKEDENLFDPVPGDEVLATVMGYVNRVIAFKNREDYKGLLYAMLNTSQERGARDLLYAHWKET